jgi:hypothetical protein
VFVIFKKPKYRTQFIFFLDGDIGSIGKPSTPTPRGTFKIINRAVNPGGPFGARWLGLSAPGGDYSIHGFLYWEGCF